MSTQRIRVMRETLAAVTNDAPVESGDMSVNEKSWPEKVYPTTQMTLNELMHAEALAPWGDERATIANTAIARAIDDGQVVPINMVEALVRHVLEKAAASVPMEFRQKVLLCVDVPAVIDSLT